MIKLIVDHVLQHTERVQIIISGDDKHATVALIPIAKKDGIAMKPINLSGPAAELDKAIADSILAIFDTNSGVISNIEEVIEDLKTQAAKKTEKAANKPADTKAAAKPAEKKKEAPKLSKLETEAIKKAKEQLEKAKKSKDPDMIEFLRKQAKKLYDDNGVDAEMWDELNAEFSAIDVEAPKEEAKPDTGLFTQEKIKEKLDKESKTPAVEPPVDVEQVDADPMDDEEESDIEIKDLRTEEEKKPAAKKAETKKPEAKKPAPVESEDDGDIIF
jgi:hypothetical protein